MKRWIACGSVVIAASCANDAPVNEGNSCCLIELERVATLAFSDAPSAPTPMFSRLEQLADGTFIVSVEKGRPELLHFAADGSFVDGHLRVGEGPGEVAYINAITVDGDSLWLVDRESNRCNLYDGRLDFIRYIQCPVLNASDVAFSEGNLYVTPLGLVEVDATEGNRRQAWESQDTLISRVYSSLATGSDGMWFVPQPTEYRVELWRTGANRPSRVLERTPPWWEPVAEFDLRTPNGSVMPEDRQMLAGPILWNVGVRDGLVWTASYVLTRGMGYMEFLDAWVNNGLQDDVRVHIEALSTTGELVASASFDDLAPPWFTSNGLLYSAEKLGLDVQIAVFRPHTVPDDRATAVRRGS